MTAAHVFQMICISSANDQFSTTRIISAAVERPPSAAREALGLGESALSVVVRRVRMVDRSPVAVMTSWLPYYRMTELIARSYSRSTPHAAATP